MERQPDIKSVNANKKHISIRPCSLFKSDPESHDKLFFEKFFWDQGLFPVAGTDEVGRGCLAGPVVAAAVILPKKVEMPNVTDSKALRASQREHLVDQIKGKCIAWAIAEIGPEEIDKINILEASLQAMKKAIKLLKPIPQALLVDGNKPVPTTIIQKTIIKGDARSLSVAASSILAKVHRDHIMKKLHRKYPQYGFDKHKGYPTKFHKEALKKYGPCPHHRTTFKGVKELVQCEKR